MKVNGAKLEPKLVIFGSMAVEAAFVWGLSQFCSCGGLLPFLLFNVTIIQKGMIIYGC